MWIIRFIKRIEQLLKQQVILQNKTTEIHPMAQDIALLFQQCDPAEALPPGDRRYVAFDNVRGEGKHALLRLTRAIRNKPPVCRLLSGHRGGGKSTELLRLQEELEQTGPTGDKFFVVYFEANEEDIDVNDVDFPDILLAIVRQIGLAFRKRLKVELRSNWFSTFFDDLKSLFGSEVEFQKLELDAKFAKFTAAIKNSPMARDEIRKALEPNTSNLIQAANDLIEEAITLLQTRGYKNLVVIVDNLDRIVLRNLNPGCTTHDHLFINRSSQLKDLRCHVIYTLPISMVFSPQAGALANLYQSQPLVIPMVKVIKPDGSDNPQGLQAMRQMVLKRLAAANLTQEDAFDMAGTLDDLCRKSGGHLRSLLLLIDTACEIAGRLPLTALDIEQAFRDMINAFDRALTKPAYFEALRQIDSTHELSGGDHDPMLLYNLSVLEYENGEIWYAVNPAVQGLTKFKRTKITPIATKP